MSEIENSINASILGTIKKMLGLDLEYTIYDQDIMVFINSYIEELVQIGVGNANFSVTGHDQTWFEFLGANSGKYDGAKSYIYYKTRLAFNPPANSFVVSAYQDLIKETAWRLSIDADMERLNAENAENSEDDDDE